MFAAFFRSLAQLSDPPVMRIVWRTMLFALLLMVTLVVALWLLLGWLTLFDWGWLDSAIDIVGGLGAIFVAWLLFPVAATAIVGFYLEDVAEIVDRRHYSHLPEARRQTVGEAIRSTISFALIAIGLNVVLLPLLFLGPLYFIGFYIVNGYLIGREYFEVVAFRRLAPADAKALRQRHMGQVFIAGVAMAFLLTVPVINLLIPVFATIFMVHLFNSLPQPSDRT